MFHLCRSHELVETTGEHWSPHRVHNNPCGRPSTKTKKRHRRSNQSGTCAAPTGLWKPQERALEDIGGVLWCCSWWFFSYETHKRSSGKPQEPPRQFLLVRWFSTQGSLGSLEERRWSVGLRRVAIRGRHTSFGLQSHVEVCPFGLHRMPVARISPARSS
jgi:hypothetical protein